MTDLYNGQITDLLNNAYRYDPDVIAFSYAILQEKQRIMQELAQTRTMSVIDDLPENILDILAVELRTPYYVDSLSIEAKREIIKKSFLLTSKAGTVSAVEELVQTVFRGKGEVIEWFEYGGMPGKWMLKVDFSQHPEIYDRSLDKIKRLLKLVGRCSAHLDMVVYVYTLQTCPNAHAAATPCRIASRYTVRLPDFTALPDAQAQAYAAGAVEHMRKTVTIKIGGSTL